MEEGREATPIPTRKQTYGSTPQAVVAVPGIPSSCWYILIVELCERLSFYTFAGSQAFFLEHMGFSLANAGGLNATMWTLCTVLAVLASWLADAVLGRYMTILVSGITYLLGAACAAIAAWPGHEMAVLYFFGVMFFLPLGTAGIKANISNFGADQYDPSDPGHAEAQERFFSVFYLSINLGAGVAYGFFTTFASSGGIGVPKRYGYFVAYALMSVCMFLAVCIYRAGRHNYRVAPLQRKSALATVGGALVRAAKAYSARSVSVLLGVVLLLASIILSAMKALMPAMGNSMTFSAFATAGFGSLAVVIPCMDPAWIVTSASPTTEEQDVQSFLRIVPVLFTGNLSFGALYNSMQFWYQQQACQMDVRMPFGRGFQLSGSFFNIADCLAIVLVTPIAVDWFNPFIERCLGTKLQHGLKFGLGMLIAGASVGTAIRLEQVRRHSSVLSIESNCAPPGIGMSDISGTWMMVPFFLMGIGEIYTQPTLLHFAYTKSAPTMRTLAMAASFFISGVSSALFAVLVGALSGYIPNDLNKGRLEFGYYVNIAIGIVFYAFFIFVLRGM
mmetsp:Transcript_48080/g.108194  ORF Transcript_48080/g.108194 Transcript_48080/m.108194 type:complete len:560 (+) Transcript_48080:125-1804(+)